MDNSQRPRRGFAEDLKTTYRRLPGPVGLQRTPRIIEVAADLQRTFLSFPKDSQTTRGVKLDSHRTHRFLTEDTQGTQIGFPKDSYNIHNIGLARDSQSTRRGSTPDSKRIHTYLTEEFTWEFTEDPPRPPRGPTHDPQRTCRGSTSDSQSIHRGSTEKSQGNHRGFA